MDKRIKPLLRDLEAQGWRIQATKDGWMCYPPDPHKEQVLIHKTPSDQNWIHVAIRRLRKSGYIPR